jgi:hypothetical protein
MCRFAAFPHWVVAGVVGWCALAPQFATGQKPAAENPLDSGPPAAAERAAGNPFDDAPAAATPFDRAPSVPPRDDPTPRLEAKIRQALEGPTSMDFTETPLQDAIGFLRDQHGIVIQFDMRALEDEGIGSDTPITRTLKGVSLASALRLLLDDVDATFVVRDGVLLITTKGAAAKMVELRVYNIGELVSSEDDAHELAEVLRALFTDAEVSRHRVLAGRRADSDKGTATTPRHAAQPAASRFDVLPYGKLLIVQASQHDHEALAQLLGEIKAKLKMDK